MKIENEMEDLIKNRAEKLYPPKERASEFTAFIQGASFVTQASNATGISRTAIANNLSYLSKSAGGFIWKKI